MLAADSGITLRALPLGPLPPPGTHPRTLVNSLLAAGSGIALNLKKDSKAADTSPVTVKIGDEEHTGGGTTEE